MSRRTLSWMFVGALVTCASVASAQEEFDARQHAKVLAEEGQRLLIQNQPEQALPVLIKAEELYHAPTIVLLIARTQATLGRRVVAYETYSRVVDEQLDASSPPPWLEAQTIARTERDALLPSLAVLRFPGLKSETVRVNGEERTLSGDARLVVEPGDAVVEWNDERGPASERLTLTAGEDRAVTRATAAPAPTTEPTSSLAFMTPLGISLVAIGGVTLITGIGTGAASLDLTSDLEELCPDKKCAETERAMFDEAEGLAVASTTCVIVGTLFAATGATLLILDATGVVAQPTVSCGTDGCQAGLVGRF